MADAKNYEQLAQKLLPLAQQGDAKSQYHLAVLYNDGKGVPKDYGQAASWYLKAAQQGHQKAQLYLGLLYQNGRGVERDYQQAAHWLELSARQGNKDAQKLLDEILGVPELELDEGDELEGLDPYDYDKGKGTYGTPQLAVPVPSVPASTSSGSHVKVIAAAVIGAVLLTAGAGAGYYFFLRPKLSHLVNTSPVQPPKSYEPDAYKPETVQHTVRNIDAFKLAATGTPEQLRDAVRRGADFNVETDIDSDSDFEGYTPLHEAAAKNRNPGTIDFIVSQGLDVNAEASHGNLILITPLSSAVSYENTEAVKALLKLGANPNKYSSSGNMFQILATSNSSNYDVLKEITEALVKAGGDINGHYEGTETRRVFEPRSTWPDNNPFSNMVDDLAVPEFGTLPYSCTALTLAVLSDNPGMVNILLDAGADAKIPSIEGKTAFDYAQELPKNAVLRKWEAFERLRKLSPAKKQSNYDSLDAASRKQLDALLKAKKVPGYVRDSGKFRFDRKYSGGIVEINGENVRLRSQPNSQARIVATTSGVMPFWDGHSLDYLGEWISPKNERWILADYRNWETNRSQPVWIFGRYTILKTERDFDLMMEIELGG